jgi:hypothetical protein
MDGQYYDIGKNDRGLWSDCVSLSLVSLYRISLYFMRWTVSLRSFGRVLSLAGFEV